MLTNEHCERYVITIYYKDKSFYDLNSLKNYVFNDSVRTAQEKQTLSVIKINLLMLDREIVTACCEIHSKQIDTLCRKKIEVFKDTFSGTYIDQRALVDSWVY